MGCINSKVIARSMSIREELNHGFHSSSLSWEELLTSHGGTDQLFAFVCSANANTIKPRLGNASLPSTENHDSGVYTRSRSYDRMINETNENKFDLRGGSKSFHTVEEYDALLERIRKFSTRSAQHFETNEDSEKGVIDKHETGWKRKALAKELKPLEVSSTVEFPDIARSRRRVRADEGQVDSPGTYVTPKFGSYNVKACSKLRENEGGEDSVFSRELVSAFEDCMKQLRYDEESILWEMDGYPSVDDAIETRD